MGGHEGIPFGIFLRVWLFFSLKQFVEHIEGDYT
jgi:hypothetical protein